MPAVMNGATRANDTDIARLVAELARQPSLSLGVSPGEGGPPQGTAGGDIWGPVDEDRQGVGRKVRVCLEAVADAATDFMDALARGLVGLCAFAHQVFDRVKPWVYAVMVTGGLIGIVRQILT